MKTKVRQARLAAGLTQQQLADRVRVSARTIISIAVSYTHLSVSLAICRRAFCAAFPSAGAPSPRRQAAHASSAAGSRSSAGYAL